MKLRVYDENDKLIMINSNQLKQLFPQMLEMQDRAMFDYKEHGANIFWRKGKLILSKECAGGECEKEGVRYVNIKPSFLHKHVLDAKPIGTFHTHFDSVEGAKLSYGDYCTMVNDPEEAIQCVGSDKPRMISCYMHKTTKTGSLSKKAWEIQKHCHQRKKVQELFYPNYNKVLLKIAEKKYPLTYYEPISYQLKKHRLKRKK